MIVTVLSRYSELNVQHEGTTPHNTTLVLYRKKTQQLINNLTST